MIGCGTYVGFDVRPDGPEGAQRSSVLGALFAAGGTVLDSSPMYGRAEATVGALLPRHAASRPFVATKVWTRGRDAGIAQMQRSAELFGTPCIDLMQVHNLVDWKTHLKTLRDWKEAGRVRYLGVTHYSASAHAELEAVLRAEPLDFVQLNYSIADRHAESRLLPLAAERGIAVLANLPLGSGGVLQPVHEMPLPAVAARAGVHRLGAIAAQVRARPRRSDLRHTGHGRPGAHGRQRGGRAGPDARRAAARADPARLGGARGLRRARARRCPVWSATGTMAAFTTSTRWHRRNRRVSAPGSTGGRTPGSSRSSPRCPA